MVLVPSAPALGSSYSSPTPAGRTELQGRRAWPARRPTLPPRV